MMPGLVESESDQARAEQHNTCHGHREEAPRSVFVSHGSSPIACPTWKGTTAQLHSQRVIPLRCQFRRELMFLCNTVSGTRFGPCAQATRAHTETERASAFY